MAKAIKRIGVIFLAVVISCLLIVGLVVGRKALNTNANLNSENLQNNNISTIADKSYTLTGSCAQMAKIWSEAITYSIENGSVNVNVVLGADWVAESHSEFTTSFGELNGFSNGRIFLPAKATITLNLNGKKVNRNLTAEIENGNVISNSGKLNIIDTSAKVDGMITGGYIISEGGGVINSNNAVLTLSSGNISYNKAYRSGGGIANQGIFIMNGGRISHNEVYGEEWASSGGGIKSSGEVYMYGGEISENHSVYVGGGAYLYSIFEMYGGYIINNTSRDAGAGMRLDSDKCLLSGGVIKNNKSENSVGGVLLNRTQVGIGAGIQIYNNYSNSTDSLVEHNLHLNSNGNINIVGKLAENGKITHVGITAKKGNSVVFTNGYNTYNSGVAPSRYFFSDVNNRMIDLVNNEVCLSAGTKPTNKVSWRWSGADTSSTDETNTAVPYTGQNYTISIGGGAFFMDNGTKATSFNVSQAGTYSFYVEGNYLNPTFMFTIQGGIIDKPSVANNTFTYNGNSQMYDLSRNGFDSSKMLIYNNTAKDAGLYYAIIGPKQGYVWADGSTQLLLYEFVIQPKKLTSPTKGTNVFVYNGTEKVYSPTIDESKMEIADNKATAVGKYTAKVSLIDSHNYCWEDGSNVPIEHSFEIIHPGVVLKDDSSFDYIYKDSNNTRQNYKDNKIIHKVSETETTSNYVIGNIAPKITLKQFVSNIRKECGYIKIYNGNTLLYDSTTETDASDSIYVATGYKVELYKNSNGTELLDIVYLSVLGDVVADGVINSLDVTFINRIAKGEIKLEDLSIEQQLAAMVDNKGKVTSTDGKILLNVIGGNTQTNDYFENVEQKDKYQILVLNKNNETGKTYRQNMNLTTLNIYDNAIIGNIAPKTKASDFKTKLATQTGANVNDIEVHKAEGRTASDNDFIGTGYYINYNGKTIYLSVLGDLTGDGEVNTTDITYLNRIVNGNIELNTNDMKDKLTMLSALIQNKGNVTTADSETLLNYIGGNADLTKYY